MEFERYIERVEIDIKQHRFSMISICSINGIVSDNKNTENLTSRDDRYLLKRIRRVHGNSILGINTLIDDLSAFQSKEILYIIPIKDDLSKIQLIVERLQALSSKILLLCEKKIGLKLHSLFLKSRNINIEILESFHLESIVTIINSLNCSGVLIEGGSSIYRMFSPYITAMHLTIAPFLLSNGKNHLPYIEQKFNLKYSFNLNSFIYTYYLSN